MEFKAINSGSTIPELIKFLIHTFRECDFDEVQNILMEREDEKKLQIEELVRDRVALKKELGLLEKTQSYTELEKCSLQEKLDKETVQMGENVRILRREKLDVEKKLDASNRTIEELKKKEIEADHSLQELQRKYLEASQTIVELRAQKMESDKAVEAYRGANLEKRIQMLEIELSNLSSADVEDFPNLENDKVSISIDSKEEENGVDISAGRRGVGSSPKGGINLAHAVAKADGASAVCTHPSSVPAVAKSCGIVQDNEGQEPNLKRKSQASSSAAPFVIELSDSDDEPDPVDAIHVPDTLSGQASKRNITECEDDSPINLTAKRERITFAQPSRCSSFAQSSRALNDGDSDNESWMHCLKQKEAARND